MDVICNEWLLYGRKKTFNETVVFCDGTLLACLAHQVEHMISLVSLWLQYIKVYFVN